MLANCCGNCYHRPRSRLAPKRRGSSALVAQDVSHVDGTKDNALSRLDGSARMTIDKATARGCAVCLRPTIAFFSVLLVFASASSAAAQQASVLVPSSPPAQSILDLFYLVAAITAVIFVLVEGVLLYSIIRFRRRAGDAAEPPQIYGSRPVELAWTLWPLLTVFVLFLIVTRTVIEMRRDPAAEDVVQVRVVGHQWWWEFQYPELGVTTANGLHVPVGEDGKPRPVRLELESADVIHSFWVPQLAGKTDVIPGRTNEMWFDAAAVGVFRGQCAEYCGTQHANMRIRVVVESPSEFERWLAAEREPAAADSSVAAGRDLFLSLACVNCHTVRGTPARGTFGPDLTHLMSRKTLASGAAEMSHENLRRWVDNPALIKPGALMPSMHLSSDEIAQVVEYLESLH
jgi:cytochrome c oxidase subunit 2